MSVAGVKRGSLGIGGAWAYLWLNGIFIGNIFNQITRKVYHINYQTPFSECYTIKGLKIMCVFPYMLNK